MCDKCYITYVTVPVLGIEWSSWQWFAQFKENRWSRYATCVI